MIVRSDPMVEVAEEGNRIPPLVNSIEPAPLNRAALTELVAATRPPLSTVSEPEPPGKDVASYRETVNGALMSRSP